MRAACGLAWPIRDISSFVEAPVAAASVFPVWVHGLDAAYATSVLFCELNLVVRRCLATKRRPSVLNAYVNPTVIEHLVPIEFLLDVGFNESSDLSMMVLSLRTVGPRLSPGARAFIRSLRLSVYGGITQARIPARWHFAPAKRNCGLGTKARAVRRAPLGRPSGPSLREREGPPGRG